MCSSVFGNKSVNEVLVKSRHLFCILKETYQTDSLHNAKSIRTLATSCRSWYMHPKHCTQQRPSEWNGANSTYCNKMDDLGQHKLQWKTQNCQLVTVRILPSIAPCHLREGTLKWKSGLWLRVKHLRTTYKHEQAKVDCRIHHWLIQAAKDWTKQHSSEMAKIKSASSYNTCTPRWTNWTKGYKTLFSKHYDINNHALGTFFGGVVSAVRIRRWKFNKLWFKCRNEDLINPWLDTVKLSFTTTIEKSRGISKDQMKILPSWITEFNRSVINWKKVFCRKTGHQCSSKIICYIRLWKWNSAVGKRCTWLNCSFFFK